MGHLAITQVKEVKNNPVAVNTAEQAGIQAQPSMQAVVYARGRQYLFNISGALPREVQDISILLPDMEKVVIAQQKHGYHTAARLVTFSGKGEPSTSVMVAGSAKALLNLLQEVCKSGTSNIETLIVHDRDKVYRDMQVFFPGSLDLMRRLVPKIQPTCFPKLTTLQIQLVPNSWSVLYTLTNLLKRGCLNQLKTLDLQYSTRSQPVMHRHGWLTIPPFSDPGELGALYRDGLACGKLTQLEHLRLPLWTMRSSEFGLKALGLLYPQLKRLAIDSVMSESAIKRETDFTIATDSGSVGHYTYNTYKITVPRLVIDDTATHYSRLLAAILEEQAENSQLERLEIYDWYIGNNKQAFTPEEIKPYHARDRAAKMAAVVAAEAQRFDSSAAMDGLGINRYLVFAHEQLAYYIANGWLPRLNAIVMRPGPDSVFPAGQRINPAINADTSHLLETVIAKEVPVKELQLLLPENTGYLPWLAHMAEGGFPLLTRFDYRLPDQLLNETNDNHRRRVMQALTHIHAALVTQRIPKLESINIVGHVPAGFEDMVRTVESALTI